MHNHIIEKKPSFILSLLGNRCPRCRSGHLYKAKGAFRIKHLMDMNPQCPVCGQPFDMEPGFYYGTNMISYALSLLVTAVSFLLWVILIGISLSDDRFFWWIGVNAVLLIFLQPPLMRLSRTVWLAFFVRYSPRWRDGDLVIPERINPGQMNNW